MKLSFHGAAGTVTGSRYLLENGQRRIEIDAGLFQGLKKLRLLNWDNPGFDPAKVQDILLTHAHIDHSGYLPRLVRAGFQGQVHCTKATEELAQLLLMDAAKIQEEDAEYANKKGFSKHKPALPLFTAEDAQKALKLFRPVHYEDWIELDKRSGIRARFHNMGHILGASCLELRLMGKAAGAKGENETTLVFSGDVGRYDMPLHRDPDPRPECDILIVESTYGDRQHDHTPVIEQLRDPFLRTFERGGLVLIPAFAVGRSQLVTLLLRDLMNEGQLPEVPIHIDSPMAINATRIYSRHLHDCNLEEDLGEDGRNRLFPRNVEFHRSVDESKMLNEMSGARVIISASGMMTGGRILHHLDNRLPDERNLVMLAGYQAAGTRGRAILEGAKSIRLHGHSVPVRAEFREIHGLSAHADSDELMRWIQSARTLPKAIIVTHGEPESSAAFAQRIEKETGIRCHVPALGEAYDLEDWLQS